MNFENTRIGSYQFEKLEGRFIEADLLAKRAEMRLEGFSDLLKRHGLPLEGRVLDLGCGPGTRSRHLSSQSEKLEVIGLD